MPRCHPVLSKVFPVVGSRLYYSLFPPAVDGAVTRNLIFLFGLLEKAKLQRERERGRKGSGWLGKRTCGKISRFGIKEGMKMH